MDKTYIDEEIAKAGSRPVINASAGISTTNSTGNGNMFTQLKNQWNNGIGVSLSIPIWDHGRTKNAVARARLERETAYLDMVETQKTLWKTIENYWLQAVTNQEKFKAAKIATESQQTSYELLSEQFRLGLKNIVDLMTGKDNLLLAQQNELQSKYMTILNIQLLEFYRDGDIKDGNN